jgi:hypothetical protein
MPDSITVKKIFNWTPLTARSKGRPKQRWEDNIIQDIHQLNIKNWTACVQDRMNGKTLLSRPKLSTKEVKCLMKKKKEFSQSYYK